jgi:hypothetical protein
MAHTTSETIYCSELSYDIRKIFRFSLLAGADWPRVERKYRCICSTPERLTKLLSLQVTDYLAIRLLFLSSQKYSAVMNLRAASSAVSDVSSL